MFEFVADAAERAGKSFVAGYFGYVLEEAVSDSWQSWQWVHAFDYGAVMGLASLMFSWLSRRWGERGTASVLPVYAYKHAQVWPERFP